MSYDNLCPECSSEIGNCPAWCPVGAADSAYQSAKSTMQPHPFIKLIAAWYLSVNLKAELGSAIGRLEAIDALPVEDQFGALYNTDLWDLRDKWNLYKKSRSTSEEFIKRLPPWMLSDLGGAVQLMKNYNDDPIIGLYNIHTNEQISPLSKYS